MTKSDRNLFFVVVIGSILFCLWLMQWSVQPAMTQYGAITYPNYSTGVFLFFSILIGGALLHFHPRYGGLYPGYQRAIDFIIFTFALNSPTLTLASEYSSDLTESTKDVIVYTVMLAVMILYAVNFVVIPFLFRQKRYVLLHRSLDVLQRIRPGNANLYNTRGQVFFAQKEFEKAIEASDRAIALTPPLKKKAEEGWFSLKDWRLIHAHQIRMSAYFELDQKGMASEDAEVIVRLNPQEPLSYMYRGVVATHQGEFAAAETDFDYASHLKLDSFRQAYLVAARGDLAYRQHKNDEAHELYRAVLDIPLNTAQRLVFHPPIYNMLGLIELREGDLEAAQEFCQEGQIINPEYKSAGLALIHALKGEWDEAVAQWRSLVLKNPRLGKAENIAGYYPCDPAFVQLIEQIIARLEPVAA